MCVCVPSVQEIANHMEKDTETYEVVQEAIDTMQRVAWHINDMKRKHEHAVRLQVRRAQKHKKQNPLNVERVISSMMHALLVFHYSHN